jgi:hypothetical protein
MSASIPSPVSPVARTARCWLAGLLLGLGGLRGSAAEDDPRFSQSLTPAQRTEAGLTQLSDDNIAVIDALVRQEEAVALRKNLPLSGIFSARRTAHERSIAGLERLTPEQLARLDQLITRRTSPDLPTLSAEVGGPPAAIRRLPGPRERPLEVHGSVSLTYGWSKAGEIRGGSMVVSVQDPSRRFTVLIGYSEYRGKGLSPYLGSHDEYDRSRSRMDYPPLER